MYCKRLSDTIVLALDKLLGCGIKPGMSIEEENVIVKANLLFLPAAILGVLMIGETLRVGMYGFLPVAGAVLAGAALCFGVVARTGRPFVPSLLLVGGLSLYSLTRVATGGAFGAGFILVPLFPFLHFFAFSFHTAQVSSLLHPAGLAAVLCVPGDPFLFTDYSPIVRQRIFIAYMLFSCAAMLGEFVRRRGQRKVALLMAKLAESAQKDRLTGLYSRGAFLERFEYEAARSAREGFPLSIVMFDIDHFKRINDEYGHVCGDEALRQPARLMEAIFRRQDTSARWGGEEFIVLLPQTDLEGARVSAEKLRAALATSVCVCGPASFVFTASFGVHQCDLDYSLDANIAAADAKLYQAKHKGAIAWSPERRVPVAFVKRKAQESFRGLTQ